MKQYLNLMQDILDNGHTHVDRTGVGRRSVFGRELRFNLANGEFPLVTTRKVFVKGMIAETLWFLTGSCNTLELEEQGVNIWKAWTPTQTDSDVFAEKLAQGPMLGDLPEMVQKKIAGIFIKMPDPADLDEAVKIFLKPKIGTIGPMYGAIWRGNYDSGDGKKGPDQIKALIEGLRNNPYGSRHTVTAQIPSLLPLPGYSPQENALLGRGALAPCHCFFQCFVTPPYKEDDKASLSLKIEIRSNDIPVGNPYNVAQYAMLLMLFAQCAGLTPGELIVSIGDAHGYLDQIEQMKEQVTREPYPLSTMKINPDKTDIFSFTTEDFTLENYQCHPVIKYPVAT